MMRTFLLVIFVLLISAGTASAQEDAAAKVCMSILSIDLRDTNNVFSDEYHFNQYQSILRSASFADYKHYADEGAGLGIDIPIGDVLIGFKGDYKSNSETFNRQMNEFLTSTYQQVVSRSVYSQYTTTINKNLLDVARNCQNKYFETLKERVGLLVKVEPNSYSQFVVSITGYIPQSLQKPFRIDQIEPFEEVQCTEAGQVVRLPKEYPGGQALFTCRKASFKKIYFTILSNANAGRPVSVTLPAEPAPASPPQTAPPATSEPVPTAQPPRDPRYLPGCIVDPSALPPGTPETVCGSPATLKPGDACSCPKYPSGTYPGRYNDHALAPPPDKPLLPLRCVVNASELPRGTPPTWCPYVGKIGDDCTCPRYPSGTYSGKLFPY